MSNSVSKARSNSLPSGTTVENLLKLIEVLVKNNKNEESIKALFGLGDSVYGRTKSALKSFGIIENDSHEFTPIGRDIAYSGEDDKKAELVKIVICYEPYKLVLDSILTSRNDTEITDINTIKNLWGKADIGSGDRNRNDGTTLFMTVVDYIGIGKYVVGRGSNPTRIEWVEDIKTKINSLNKEIPIAVQKENTSQQDRDTTEADVINTAPVEEEQEVNIPDVVAEDRNDKITKKPFRAVSFPNITINVDMSDWSDEKIKTFFKYAYGKFEED